MNNMSSWSVVASVAFERRSVFACESEKGRVIDLRPRSYGNNANTGILRDIDGFSHPDWSKKSEVQNYRPDSQA
jgi:hypothetical protein